MLFQVIASVLEYEKPDFVALSGDMVSGFAWDGRKGWFEERWGPLGLLTSPPQPSHPLGHAIIAFLC